jgi:hypothetical protein
MQNVTPNELAELLDRNDYRVVVKTTDGGCLAEFPQRRELPIMPFVRLYQEYKPEGILTCEYDESGAELRTQELSCPSYAQRVFTVYHVIYHCMGIGYDLQLIKFVADKDEVDEETFLKADTSPFMVDEDVQKEVVLKNLIGQCFNQGFLPMHEQFAKQEGLLEGFIPIRRLFVPDDMMNQMLTMLGDKPHE